MNCHLKSLNHNRPVQIDERLFVGLHSMQHLAEYRILQIDTRRRKVWAAVEMSPRAKPIGLRDWLSAYELDCEWIDC